MPQINGFRIKNYKTLKDITIGNLWNNNTGQSLTPLTVVIGKNGTGKSSLFDAFGFISDCLKKGVEDACEIRGGYHKMFSKGQNIAESMEFEIYYREGGNDRPITYEFAITLDKNDRPYVLKERLRQRRLGQRNGWPFSFLALNSGEGIVWKGETAGQQIEENFTLFDTKSLISQIEKGEKTEETNETEIVRLEDNRKLGITTLGALKQHPRISAFRKFIESWYLSYFTPDAARALPLAGAQKHLDIHGDNLANVVQFMQREQPKRFQSILDRIAQKIPGLEKIDTETTEDRRLLLRFYGKGFDKDPFYAQQMSDGTLKVFTYMLLMEDPEPHSFICIEEPENGLYHKLLEILATEFRDHATGKKGGSQIFITTHQPYFVNALNPEEVWILEKQDDGFSKIHRASDSELVKNLVAEELPLGALWYSNYLD
ncbi:MAG: ATPase [Fibrobacteres bacterium CG2_30_45_31]|nr:MAG: ATPase [Fibrobacteres bacterium CG2_30_45_31]